MENNKVEKLVYSYDLYFEPKVRAISQEIDEIKTGKKVFFFNVLANITYDERHMAKAAGFEFDWDRKVWFKKMTRKEYMTFNKFTILKNILMDSEVSNEKE